MAIPGYVDLQVNGHIGVDFSSNKLNYDDFCRAAEALFEAETVVFLPTVITSTYELYRRNCALIQDAVERNGWQKQIPGIHLEGPFISAEPGAVGCHNPDWVAEPDLGLIDELGSIIKMITVAAEVPGITDFIKGAVERGLIVSLGHQNAGTEDLQRAEAAGASTLTHLGNGIPNMVNRHHNAIWSGLSCDGLTAMIITDGHHLPPEVIKVVLRTKGIDNVIVTSDAAPAAGLPPGRYNVLGNDAILEESGKLRCADKDCLAGSGSTMKMCVEYLASLDLLSQEELEKVSYHNAMNLLDKHKKLAVK